MKFFYSIIRTTCLVLSDQILRRNTVINIARKAKSTLCLNCGNVNNSVLNLKKKQLNSLAYQKAALSASH